jgi:hypothetical protein
MIFHGGGNFLMEPGDVRGGARLNIANLSFFVAREVFQGVDLRFLRIGGCDSFGLEMIEGW